MVIDVTQLALLERCYSRAALSLFAIALITHMKLRTKVERGLSQSSNKDTIAVADLNRKGDIS